MTGLNGAAAEVRTVHVPLGTRAYDIRIGKGLLDRAGAAGLIRFKSAFAPSWSPRYAAAPGRAGLALALADIPREVHHPYALRHGNLFHEQDEEYELAPRRAA